MRKDHNRAFGVYYWDTFDNNSWLVGEFDTLKEAIKFVKERYIVHYTGADRVQIVNENSIVVENYSISGSR